MKNIDYEMIFNYISLILAISIFIIILYTCYTKNNIENFETEKVTATGKAIIGGVSKVEVTNGGSDVEEGTTIYFSEPEDSEDGEKAEGTATISDGKVTEIKVTKSGKGYTSAPTVSLKGGADTGLETTVTLGALSHIKITNPGKGYGSVPTIDIGDAPADGVKAELTAVVTNGEITSVTVNNAGDGYNADFDVTFQSPQDAEDDSNPILSLGDKKEEVLKLLESCKKINDDKKEQIKKNINEDTLKKLEVEELISILNK
jgi:hypothetical protein